MPEPLEHILPFKISPIVRRELLYSENRIPQDQASELRNRSKISSLLFLASASALLNLPRVILFPPDTSTHISALLVQDEVRLAENVSTARRDGAALGNH